MQIQQKNIQNLFYGSLNLIFQQYRDSTQIGGPIAPDELTGKYYVEIVSTIVKYQIGTKNKFFTDLSPWLNDEFKTWQEGYPQQYVDGFFGGWNVASDFIKTDPYNLIKYSDVNKLYLPAGTTNGDNKLPIIGQAGWGVNGAGVDNWRPWVDVTNIRARLVNHLVATTFQHETPTTLVSQMNELLGHTRDNNICWWRDRTGDGPVVDGGSGDGSGDDDDSGIDPNPPNPGDDDDEEEEWTIDTTKYPTPPPRDTSWDFVRDELNGCSFGYGVGYVDEYKDPQFESFPFDYITVWYQNKAPEWNEWWIGKALALAIKYNKPLGIFAYVIAGSAKVNLNIQDCDVHPTENLCYKGANWMRQNWESNIIPQYQRAGEEITKAIQTWNNANPTKKYTKSILWFIEPDFQQYRGAEQLDGGIPMSKLTGKYYVEIVSTIVKYQIGTKNKFFVDVSPWLNDEFNAWMESYPQQYVDGFYGGLNAKSGDDYVKANAPYEKVTYTQINQLYTTNHQGNNGLPIFGQAGWGVNGADQSSDVYKAWIDANNIKDKLKKNVFAATFSNSDVNVIMDVMKNTLSSSSGDNKQWDYGVCYWKNIQSKTNNLGNSSIVHQQSSIFMMLLFIIVGILSFIIFM
eukprot:UN01280